MIPPGLIVESDALRAAPWYRREPYLVLFPLGVVLSWAGVLHWLLLSVGILESYRPIFHAMTQVQGFLMCFAVGFLFTMIPRRTGTRPPSTPEIAVAVAAPVATTLAAWLEHWLVAQVAFLVLAGSVVQFAVRRFLGAGARRRPPNSFVWIPLALFMGILGSLMTGLYAFAGPEHLILHEVGRGLVLQGMFIGLVLGVGGLAFPLMTRGQAPPDSGAGPRDRGERLAHAAAAIVLMASFFLEPLVSPRAGTGLRAVVILAVMTFGVQLWRLPSLEGWTRRLIWLSGWLLPAGYVLMALYPDRPKAGLHVAFIGGFAMLALAVSMQVTLGHRGHRRDLVGRPWQVAAVGALMLAAVVARFVMEIDRSRFFFWMGAASSFFLAATLVWLAFLLPRMLRPASE